MMHRKLRLSDLTAEDRKLVEAARNASRNAYAPYSGFAVGAAVRCVSGSIFSGANLENASFGLAICAEISALTAANSSGDMMIDTIAIVGHKFSIPRDTSQVVMPCGRCRQVIAEFGKIAGLDVRILACNGDLSEIHETHISDLLPHAFGPDNLGLTNEWPKIRQALAETVAGLIGGIH